MQNYILYRSIPRIFNYNLISLLCLLLLVIWPLISFSTNNEHSSPLEFIDLLYENVHSLNKANISKSKRLEKMQKLIEENIDFPIVAKFVLGSKIRLLSPEEVQAFTKYYKNIVLKKYAKLLTTQFKSYKVVHKDALGNGRYLVHTILKRDGINGSKTLKIIYLVIEKNNNYKIIDITIPGGISMATADREDVTAFFERGTLQEFKEKFMQN